ncbi:MAG: hypothetical protein IKZ28_00625 [Clostridia bacterium]|nr:hypothetical protein [Clostridia bacterium]
MEQKQRKQTEEALAEIYRNAQLALTSIADILPEIGEDEKIREELLLQHEEYEKISARASILARDLGIELKEPNVMKKAMMWGSIKMNTMKDNSRSHIAEMMTQGTVMGITALCSTQGEVSENGDERILSLLEEMIATEEKFEERWKEYL